MVVNRWILGVLVVSLVVQLCLLVIIAYFGRVGLEVLNYVQTVVPPVASTTSPWSQW